ncbi:NADP-dependent aldehyde dehydrogenase [Micromonospora phaseoli]|uniref:NADP-dependent aldehyde dehydrogenase n=1 Tax=Micromonospora phaseoli TaxID=1144548 RepID=A0A1H7DPT7_9ACTN|nr:aldehyde dehydrogenase (NADP(+)) [Micromonospora phaseoli]PZV89446.1 NADP-dependent aldehyde dehydrogenase [Micromonospora phaseoli]GIJ80269.1 aldehyde dehydrogenase [Micromonospora phaseoli]SEK02877.1 NADP-dependent aldehyde dehydrogenase [Micromonospora phaseoli]
MNVTTTDPRDGRHRTTDLTETAESGVATIADQASRAAQWLFDVGRLGRAQLLDAIATSLESRRVELVGTAEAETGLAPARLDSELTRAAVQFRMFEAVLRDGGYLEAAIDHAADTPLGPGPDLRRMLVPLGPVAVFGASNFPFAFSVAGGDTASALAAGCPTVVKAHPSHPLTSRASADAIESAVRDLGGPGGVIATVYGEQAGRWLVRHPTIRAAALTGSVGAARAIQAAIDERADPVPLYAELSSVNPIVILPDAAAGRGDQIAEGLFASFTGSGGQLCTKPGLAFVPSDPGGDHLVATLRGKVASAGGMLLLNQRIRDAYENGAKAFERAGARLSARPQIEAGTGFTVAPTLLEVDLPDLTAEIADECFGPLMVVVRYRDVAELDAALATVPPSLTGSVHSGPRDDNDAVRELVDVLAARSGRIVFDGYPTGVRVSWAQHHGGPWPSTNAVHTSVGATAIRRFLRPLAWQNAPEWILPEELRDAYTAIPRRVDGRLVSGLE